MTCHFYLEGRSISLLVSLCVMLSQQLRKEHTLQLVSRQMSSLRQLTQLLEVLWTPAMVVVLQQTSRNQNQ